MAESIFDKVLENPDAETMGESLDVPEERGKELFDGILATQNSMSEKGESAAYISNMFAAVCKQMNLTLENERLMVWTMLVDMAVRSKLAHDAGEGIPEAVKKLIRTLTNSEIPSSEGEEELAKEEVVESTSEDKDNPDLQI